MFMSVRRIVPNLPVADPTKAKAFYGDLLGLKLVMDQGWIMTFASSEKMSPQLSFMTEGGSGTPVPQISIEVADVDEAYARVKSAGYEIVYGPTHEPWGVRRFFARDPFGIIVNILTHDD
jgi:catechol 2,3-dioxygenase-like lactoylglutathione lyase family enzyme